MAQGGGVYTISREALAEAEARGQAPGACAARERSLLAPHWGWEPKGEIVPSGGSGPGLSMPCKRDDCEWRDEGLRPVAEGSKMMTGTPCPRWVRLALASSETATNGAENDPCTS